MNTLEIIQTPHFKQYIHDIIENIYLTRMKTASDYFGISYKVAIVKRLKELKVFEPKAIMDLYIKIHNENYVFDDSSRLTAFIKEIGDIALCKTIVKLRQANEKPDEKNA